MDYITLILSELEHKAKYIAIMDDLLVTQYKSRALVVDRTTFPVNGEEWAKIKPKEMPVLQNKFGLHGK